MAIHTVSGKASNTYNTGWPRIFVVAATDSAITVTVDGGTKSLSIGRKAESHFAMQPRSVQRSLLSRLLRAPSECGGKISLTREDCQVLADVAKDFPGLLPQEVSVINPATVPTTPQVGKTTPAPVQPSNLKDNTLAKTHRRTESHRRMNGTATGINDTERELSSLQNVVNTLSGDMYALDYDIPTGHPNPAHWLWGFGFPLSESVWVLKEETFNSERIQNAIRIWKEAGATVNVVRWDRRDIGVIREIARDKLCKKLIQTHTSLLKRIEDASAAFQAFRTECGVKEEAGEIVTNGEIERALDKRDQNTRKAITDSREALENCLKCAELFDETGSVTDLVQALRQALRAQTIAFNGLKEARGQGHRTLDVPTA